MHATHQSALFAPASSRQTICVFVCGDVMTGRGVDQILPHPCDPALYEDYARSALDYVRLAERRNGEIPRPVAPSYVWGVALDELRCVQPDARIVNLETSVTRSNASAGKGINYRMSPENAVCLVAAGVDCCVLGNNHVLDWERAGLMETLATLEDLGIKTAGAGRDINQAASPAVLEIAGKGRIIIFSFASPTSGVPRDWAATPLMAGVNLLPDFTDESIVRIVKPIASFQQPGDVVIASVHWGSNWGYEIAYEQRRLARALIDRANVSLVHGHSSHHAKGVETYKGRLILYGCGDFINDYEGIQSHEEFRGDLAVMYFPSFDATSGDLVGLELKPLKMRHFQLGPASIAEAEWMRQMFERESSVLDGRFMPHPDGKLALSRRVDTS